MPRGTDPTTIANQSAPGTTWPPAGGAPQVIVRLPDLRVPQAPTPKKPAPATPAAAMPAPTKIVAIDAPHLQPVTPSSLPTEPPAVQLEGPHWGRVPSEPKPHATDWTVPLTNRFTKHPLVAQAFGLAQRRAEILMILVGVMVLQVAIQFAWRMAPKAETEVMPAVAAPTNSAANQFSETARPPLIETETHSAPRDHETFAPPINSPMATAPATETSQPVNPSFAPTMPPSSPETGTTTEPRDVPPWESWPTQPKAAEPASNQAASNSPAKVSDAPMEPTLAPPQSSFSSARPKSVARLKGTISKPPVEPTHEHARRSLY
jgi:hypothetical protein